MNIESVSFREFPFSRLFLDYLSESDDLLSFYDIHPQSESAMDEHIEHFRFPGDRNETVKALRDFNEKFDAPSATFDSIEKLKLEGSMAVVTGQQMSIYGGPLFTIYKLITAILKAKELERRSGRSVIPVFWLADEDHDYQEIASLTIPLQDEPQSVSYEAGEGKGVRISDLKSEPSFYRFRSRVAELLQESDFTPALLDLLDDCYTEGDYLGISFGRLILKLFGKQGVVLAGSNSNEFKNLMKKPLSTAIEKATELEKSLKETSDKLTEAGYHTQVTIQESNLFFIDENRQRLKIRRRGGRWETDEGAFEWGDDELVQKIISDPELFSPNVFMRPVVQNYLIPAVAYVAGPGEIAYYAQMKEFYRHFDLKMPAIIPRFSITLVESPIARIQEKLPFRIPEFMERIEDLEKRYITQSDTADIEAIFKQWKSSVEEYSGIQVQKIAEVDPTLKKSADKTVSQFFTELDKLKGKLYKSVKEDEKIQIRRIRKIQNHLFPGLNLQEREVAFIYFMNRYGLDIWDRLSDQLAAHQPVNHKVLYL